MSEEATLVTVLRHGAVDGPDNVLRGSTDTPLSAIGRRQMLAAFAALDTPVTLLASSPLLRCSAFARELAALHRLPLHVHEDLREIGFGDWENLTPDAARAVSPALFDTFMSAPEGVTPPNGEPFDAFRRRVGAAFEACLARSRGGHVLVVTHAAVMRASLSSLLDMPWPSAFHIAIPPAGSFRLSCLEGHAPYLLALNAPCAA